MKLFSFDPSIQSTFRVFRRKQATDNHEQRVKVDLRDKANATGVLYTTFVEIYILFWLKSRQRTMYANRHSDPNNSRNSSSSSSMDEMDASGKVIQAFTKR